MFCKCLEPFQILRCKYHNTREIHLPGNWRQMGSKTRFEGSGGPSIRIFRRKCVPMDHNLTPCQYHDGGTPPTTAPAVSSVDLGGGEAPHLPRQWEAIWGPARPSSDIFRSRVRENFNFCPYFGPVGGGWGCQQ